MKYSRTLLISLLGLAFLNACGTKVTGGDEGSNNTGSAYNNHVTPPMLARRRSK